MEVPSTGHPEATERQICRPSKKAKVLWVSETHKAGVVVVVSAAAKECGGRKVIVG
jgi:hypothetical protein|tara:strand:- start:707 stop:874 length:168 start_codon:yes stop_codon:yes gene_type:complete